MDLTLALVVLWVAAVILAAILVVDRHQGGPDPALVLTLILVLGLGLAILLQVVGFL